MDFKFGNKKEETKDQEDSGSKGRQNILLLVLLILAGAAAYLYFFTDMIKPLNEKAPAESPVPQAIKKPLPPREGEAAKGEVAAVAGAAIPGKPEPAKIAQSVPVANAPAAAGQVAEQKSKAKEEPKKVEAPKTAAAKAQPVVEKKEKKAPATEKAAPAAKKEPAKPAKKSTVTAKTSGRWTLLVGSYVIESNLSVDLAKVKKAGLEPAIKPGSRKKSTMNRLVVAEYADSASAKAELNKIARYTSDAFIIEHGGKHTLYAGSYILDSRATSEKERLAAAGYKLSLRRVEVAIPSKSLTAGVFSDRKVAEAALKKLKDAGLKGSLVRQ